MQMSPEIAKLALALSKAQFLINGAVMDSDNLFFKSKYADLESVWSAIKKPLHENELAVLQPQGYQGAEFGIFTILTHSSGEFVSGFTPVKAKDATAQSMGSGISYARRYALASMLGVYQVDDDGNHATQGFYKAPDVLLKDLPTVIKSTAAPVYKTAPATATLSPKGPAATNAVPKPVSKGPAKKWVLGDIDRKKMFATAHEAKWAVTELKAVLLNAFGVKSSKELTEQQFKVLLNLMKIGKNPNQAVDIIISDKGS